MRRRFVGIVLAIALGLGLAASVSWAAGPVVVKTSFSFFVKDKEFPPGTYELLPQGQDLGRLAIRSTSGGDMMILMVTTRLADLGLRQAQVVFDVADGRHYLSEVHAPGMDGYALQGAPGKHTHATVMGTE